MTSHDQPTTTNHALLTKRPKLEPHRLASRKARRAQRLDSGQDPHRQGQPRQITLQSCSSSAYGNSNSTVRVISKLPLTGSLLRNRISLLLDFLSRFVTSFGINPSRESTFSMHILEGRNPAFQRSNPRIRHCLRPNRKQSAVKTFSHN